MRAWNSVFLRMKRSTSLIVSLTSRRAKGGLRMYTRSIMTRERKFVKVSRANRIFNLINLKVVLTLGLVPLWPCFSSRKCSASQCVVHSSRANESFAATALFVVAEIQGLLAPAGPPV